MPAGASVLLAQAGKDASEAFQPFHSPDIVAKLGLGRLVVGTLDPRDVGVLPTGGPAHSPPPTTTTASSTATTTAASAGSSSAAVVPYAKPPLEHMLHTFDFEVGAGATYATAADVDSLQSRVLCQVVARRTMAPAGWAYYSSGADGGWSPHDSRTLQSSPRLHASVGMRPLACVRWLALTLFACDLVELCWWLLW